jgi:hypothetical protein
MYLVSFLAVVLMVAFSTTVVAMRQDEPSPQAVVAESPRFELVVYQVQDPYAGTITSPAELDPAMRYIGAEVAIVNKGDVPLTTGRSYVRLRDVEGRDYLATAIGTETALQNRVISNGEQVRGWVWFPVPVDAEISHIYLVPSAIEVVMPWEDAPVNLPGAATPDDASPEATPFLALPEGTEKALPSD